LFKRGCGMLGWTPECVISTPIPWLQLALDGRTEWEMRRNGQDPAEASNRKRQSEPDPEKVRSDIKRILGGRAKAQRQKRESRKKRQ